MTTKSYELLIHTNRNLDHIYRFIGGFVSTYYDNSPSGDDYPDVDCIMASHANETNHPDYQWWKANVEFKGRTNSSPFDKLSNLKSFYDKNFPNIVFAAQDSDEFVRDTIKKQFFRKFNQVVDDVDGATLIEEVKMLIDSNVFTERFNLQYCNEILAEYELFEKMFAHYVIEKVELSTKTNTCSTLVFYLKNEPTKEIVDNVIARIQYFIDNYAELMIETKMDDYNFFPATIEEAIEDPDNFKVLFVEMVEHVTQSTTKRIL